MSGEFSARLAGRRSVEARFGIARMAAEVETIYAAVLGIAPSKA